MNCDALIKAIEAYIEKVDDDLVSALDNAGFIDAEDTVNEIATLEDRVARELKDETKYITDAAEQAADLEAFAKAWPDLKHGDNIDEKLSEIFFEDFTKLIPKFVSAYVTKIDPELVVDMITKRTTAWVENWSKELGEIMKLGSHTEIEQILTTGLMEGQSIAEFTQAMLDSGVRDEYYKARRVAVTEVLTAHSAAQQEAYKQSPAVEEKEWRHTGAHKNNPRPNHVEMDSQRVPAAAVFKLKGADGAIYYPLFPRDPSELPAGERVHCHCISQPIVSEEILGLSIEERRRLQEEAIAEDDGEWEKELDAKNRAKAGFE